MSSQLPRHLLPESLLQIADYCGDDIMWKVWKHYGGGRLYIPAQVSPDHELSELLGFADACLLCQAFPGENMRIDKAQEAQNYVRDTLIRQAKDGGVRNIELVRRFRLSDRRIQQIKAMDESASMNFDVFEL